MVGGKQRVVDVVKDVFKVLAMVWAADVVRSFLHCYYTTYSTLLQGGVTLKTNDAPHGMYTAYELFDILGDLYERVNVTV